MCKKWFYKGICSNPKKCNLLHVRATFQDKGNFETKNCKQFNSIGHCDVGDLCSYRHEHRNIEQIKRYHYQVKLYTLESLFTNSKDKVDFVDSYESDGRKLPVFATIVSSSSQHHDS